MHSQLPTLCTPRSQPKVPRLRGTICAVRRQLSRQVGLGMSCRFVSGRSLLRGASVHQHLISQVAKGICFTWFINLLLVGFSLAQFVKFGLIGFRGIIRCFTSVHAPWLGPISFLHNGCIFVFVYLSLWNCPLYTQSLFLSASFFVVLLHLCWGGLIPGFVWHPHVSFNFFIYLFVFFFFTSVLII